MRKIIKKSLLLKAKSYKLKAKEGFTLVESLVAIAVFTVGISAAIFVIQQSFFVGARVKNKIIAAHLAQEGIEVIRNIRDRNWIQGKVYNVGDVAANCFNESNCWTNGINDSDGSGNFTKTGCVQYNNASLAASPCALGPHLSFDGSYYISVGSGVSYQFSRDVTTEFVPLDTIPDPDEPEHLKVISTVTCGIGCSVSLEEYLYNWK